MIDWEVLLVALYRVFMGLLKIAFVGIVFGVLGRIISIEVLVVGITVVGLLGTFIYMEYDYLSNRKYFDKDTWRD